MRKGSLWLLLACGCGAVFAQEAHEFQETAPPDISLSNEDPSTTESDDLQAEQPRLGLIPVPELDTPPVPPPAPPIASPEYITVRDPEEVLESPQPFGVPGIEFPPLLLLIFASLGLLLLLLILLILRAVRRRPPVPSLAPASLGILLGTLPLGNGASIHYVRTGAKVLLLGVSGNFITVLREMDSDSTVPRMADHESDTTALPQLARSQQLADSDDDLVALRNDIHRLQQTLQERSREKDHSGG